MLIAVYLVSAIKSLDWAGYFIKYSQLSKLSKVFNLKTLER